MCNPERCGAEWNRVGSRGFSGTLFLDIGSSLCANDSVELVSDVGEGVREEVAVGV
jgi:hypothetical protein